MKFNVFSIYDTKAQLYGPCFLQQNVAMAMRDFASGINDPTIRPHAADYNLFELGTFDNVSAVFDLLAAPVRVANGVEVVRIQE